MNRIKSGPLGFYGGPPSTGLFGAGGGMAAVPMLSAMGWRPGNPTPPPSPLSCPLLR